MLISIIIPVYNTSEYLLKCLDSVFDQDYLDLEVIAINDGSTDCSKEILSQYEKKESRLFVINKQNEGVVIARNTGIKKAKGEWIMFVDSDDYLLPNCIGELFNESKKHDAEIIAANFIYDYCHKKVDVVNNMLYENNFKGWSKALLGDNVAPSLYSKIYKKSLFEDISVSNKFKIGEDFVTTVFLFKKSQKIKLVDRFAYAYLQRSNSVMHKPSKVAVESIPLFMDWIIDFYSRESFFLDSDFQDKLSLFIINRYYLYLILGGKLAENSSLYEIINKEYLDRLNIKKEIPRRRISMLKFYRKSYILGCIFRRITILITRLK